MITSFLLFGYFGPETVLPVTSIIATIAGLAMMFGRHTLRLIMSCGRLILSGRAGTRNAPTTGPTYRGPHHSRSDQPDRVATGQAESYDQAAA
jgi:hypothetical protein